MPPVLAVLRHALADPLSAATAKAEVLAARLHREAPSLAARAEDLGADLATAGRLLDLLSALSDIVEEMPEAVSVGRLVSPFGRVVGEGAGSSVVRVRPETAAEAIRRVVAFGKARGGMPVVLARVAAGRVEIFFEDLGPLPPFPLDRLLLLPREVSDADELFVAHAGAVADGGALQFSAGGNALGAKLSWPEAVEAP